MRNARSSWTDTREPAQRLAYTREKTNRDTNKYLRKAYEKVTYSFTINGYHDYFCDGAGCYVHCDVGNFVCKCYYLLHPS